MSGFPGHRSDNSQRPGRWVNSGVPFNFGTNAFDPRSSNTSNEASFENYYGMAGSCTNTNYTQPSHASYNRVFDQNQANRRNVGGNLCGGKFKPHSNPPKQGQKKKKKEKKKLNKQSAPQSRTELMIIKKKQKVKRKKLCEFAAEYAPEGTDVSKLKLKTLKKYAAPELYRQNKIEIGELSKTALVQIASEFVSDRLNLQAISKKKLKALIKHKHANEGQKTGGNKQTDQLSKTATRKKKAQEMAATEILRHSALADNPEDSKTSLSNPIKLIHTPYERKQQLDPKRSNKVKEDRKFTPKTIRVVYEELKSNKALDYRSLVVVGYLRFTLFEVFPKNRVHALEVSKYILHRDNVLKLLQYEVKKLLDERFGVNNNLESHDSRREFLLSTKKEVLRDDNHFFKDGQLSRRSDLIDGCIALLTANVYPDELIPTPSDYLLNKGNAPSPEESVQEFQSSFITLMYEALGYVIIDDLSIEDKIKYHIDNKIIPALLVEYVRSYETYVVMTHFRMFNVKPGDQLALPDFLKRHLMRKASISYLRNPMLGKMYDQLVANNRHVQTKITDILPADTKISSCAVRDLANVILFSDEMFSLVYFQLIDHTPYLSLTKDEKLAMFNELVKTIYKQALEILESKLVIHDMDFHEVGERANIKPNFYMKLRSQDTTNVTEADVATEGEITRSDVTTEKD